MNLTLIDCNSPKAQNEAWMVVHATGCADIRRYGPGNQNCTLDASTVTEAAADLASDFIAEGSMTLDQALDDIHFAPCVKLPKS